MKYDPSEFQTILNGRFMSVSELSKEELQQELCAAYHCIEVVQKKLYESTAIETLDNFMNGKGVD